MRPPCLLMTIAPAREIERERVRVSEQPQYNEKTAAAVEDTTAPCFIVRMFAARPPMAVQKNARIIEIFYIVLNFKLYFYYCFLLYLALFLLL
jgi:hypothetical protein